MSLDDKRLEWAETCAMLAAAASPDKPVWILPGEASDLRELAAWLRPDVYQVTLEFKGFPPRTREKVEP